MLFMGSSVYVTEEKKNKEIMSLNIGHQKLPKLKKNKENEFFKIQNF